MTADAINGSFELMAVAFILNHCRVLYVHKEVRGVSVLSAVFFTCWGLWNLYYYPLLEQSWSFAAGLGVVAANTLYVGMLAYYSWPKRICPGCATALPEGCGGLFSDDGDACWVSRRAGDGRPCRTEGASDAPA